MSMTPFVTPQTARAAVISPPRAHLCGQRGYDAPCGRPEMVVACPVSGCQGESMHTVFEAAGGGAGMLRLAEAWHRRVMADELVAHAFSHGFKDDHTPRLAAYLGEALGGPPVYTERYGDESYVVRIHSGNGEHT